MAEIEQKNIINTIPIKNLLQTSSVNENDILIIEDETTTYKIKAIDLVKFIRETVKDTFIQLTEKGIANGVTPLDSNTKIDSHYLSFGKSIGDIYDGNNGKILEDALNTHKNAVNPHKLTSTSLGLDHVENKNSAEIRSEITSKNITDGLGFVPEIDGAYENAVAYTDKKVSETKKELIGGASDALDTFGELEKVFKNNSGLIEGLNNAIIEKANQAELDTHTGNGTIHITAIDKENLSTALSHSKSTHARIDATKTEPSTTNGNIKINGSESNVYNHPLSNVTAGTYRQVSVDSNGHVIGGNNTTLPITQGGTGATTAKDALIKLGVTSTAEELNKLDGATISTSELNYMRGVTSPVQTQLNGKAAVNHGNHLPDITAATSSKLAMSNGVLCNWYTPTINDVTAWCGYKPGTGSNIVTAVKGNAETEYKTGNINITPTSIGLGRVDNTHDNEKSVLEASRLATASVDKENLSTALSHSKSTHARIDATKTEPSTTNGNIKINGSESNVYNHPLSNVTAGTYRQVSVDSNGHVIGGNNTTLPITQGGTGATTAKDALIKLGVTSTAVKGNAETAYKTGNVNITPTSIGLGNVANERQYSANNPQVNISGTANSANRLNIIDGNEVVFGNGFAGGEMQVNYKGSSAPITRYVFYNGASNHGLAKIRAAEFVGNLDGTAIAATNVNGGYVYSNSIGNDYSFFQVGGGTFVTGQSNFTGYLKITLPVSWTNTMIKMEVNIYDYQVQGASTYYVGGYNYNNNARWHSTFAYSIGGYTSGRTVRFGHDGSKCCIYIGEANTVWSFPQISINNVLTGYSGANYQTWSKNWQIGFTTSLGTITSTESGLSYVKKGCTWNDIMGV